MFRRGPCHFRSGERGNLHVLEAVLLSLILLSAAYWTTTLGSSTTDTARPRANIERLSQDALVVLSGLEDERGSLLDLFLVEAMHCKYDPVPSATACDGTRSANLSFRLESYLPTGVGYAYGIDNGAGMRDLHRSFVPGGEVTSASFPYVPDWNLTFVQPELSCYEVGMDVNATLVPLRNARHANASDITVRASNNATANATASHAPFVWNVTMPAAARPASGALAAEVNASGGTYVGIAGYRSCDLAGLGPSIVNALRGFTFTASETVVPLGGTVTFEADLQGLAALGSVVLLESNVTIYEPLPGRGTEADTYVPADAVRLGTGLAPQATWAVPEDSLYGIHPVVLQVDLKVGDTHVRATKVETLSVALPSGHVPIDPPYRAILQVWFPDWA